MSDDFEDHLHRRRAEARQYEARHDARSAERRRVLHESARRRDEESERRRRSSEAMRRQHLDRGKQAQKEMSDRQERAEAQRNKDGRSERSARLTPSATSPSRGYTAHRARKMQRRVNAHTLGNHVEHESGRQSRRTEVTETIRRRARLRRLIAGVIGVLVVVGVATAAGIFAFRGSVGSSMTLKDSDATDVLVPVASEDPYYMLIAVELGAVAEPLENPGPDCLVLARVDNANHSLGLINIPANLQVTYENQTFALSSIAEESDAKLIQALSGFTKLDISHYVKIDEEGMANMVDQLGGIEIDLEQVIDDPQAGDMYLPMGPYTLNGPTTLYYLRASNLKMGTQDKMDHQLKLASLLIERVFGQGILSTNIDAIDECFQTDASLADLEAIASWFQGKGAGDVIVANLPGYLTGITNIDDKSEQRYVSSYDDFLSVLSAIEGGQAPTSADTDKVEAADPASFTVEIQNGTGIPGLAAATSDELKEKGFKVGEVGNAEAQVYEQTLVVYRDEKGLSQAKAVIEALGIGRPVGNSEYYTFEGDVVVIIGSDYAPVN